MSAPRALSLGALLRQFRIAAGLTQDELAQRARLSVRAISDLERGVRRTPHKDTLALLAEALSLNENDQTLFTEAARRSRGAQTPTSPVAARVEVFQGAIPVALTPLIGREREEAAIARLLEDTGVRLLTLTGPAGIGKTRLALQVAANLRARFADGVVFVPLASLTEHALVLPAIAQALGLQEQAGLSAYDQVTEYLAGREALLTLDNFEQVAGAAATIASVLAACPMIKALVTSRAALRVRGEQEFAIPPLDTPDPAHLPSPDDLAQYAAVALFIHRAQAVKPAFALTPGLAPTIAEICARMDGLPLALELAAARIKLLSPQALLARLDSSLRVLTNGPADLPQRQQTMRRAIAWSYALLDEPERCFFRQLAVFSGGWTLEAAEAIYGESDGQTATVLDALASLVDKSLVIHGEDATGEPRFRLLELIRAYGWEMLAERGEEGALSERHADYYLALAEKAERELHGGDQIIWLDRLEIEHANLRAALRWAEESGAVRLGLQMSGALWWFWQVRGHLSEGRGWLERFLALQESAHDARDTALRAGALKGAGNLAWFQGDLEPATAFLEASLTLYRDLNDRRGTAPVLNTLGLIADGRGDYEQAISLFEQSLALWRELQEETFIAGVLNNLAMVAYHQERYTRAIELYEESLSLHQAANDHWSIAVALCNLGEAAHAQGDLARAAALLENGLALYADLNDKEGAAFALCNLGDVAREQGALERAAHLYGRSVTLAREVGSTLRAVDSLDGAAEVAHAQGKAEQAARLFALATELREKQRLPRADSHQARYTANIVALRAALGDEAFTAAWVEGQAMSLDDLGGR